MKILITGANGYIGSSLYSHLSKKFDVSKLTRTEADLTEYESLKKFFEGKFFDVVIHCAVNGGSRLSVDDWTAMDRNLIMYFNLTRFDSHYTRFIHFGSGAEDYMATQPYGFSKKVISNSIKSKENYYNLKIFAVFDENELNTRFIKGNILRYLAGDSMIVHQNKLMDFFYMKDLISVVEYYIKNDGLPKEIECVYLEKYYLTNIAEKINRLDTWKVDIKLENSKPTDRYIGKLGITPNIPLIGFEEGLKETYLKLKNK